MSILNKLFGRHRKTDANSSLSINWPGESGKEYTYTIYPMEAAFEPLPGNYIYARQSEDGQWVPIYMAQTRDLHQRLEGHVRMENAIENGASHLHAHYCLAGQAARCTEERDLVLQWHPVCNEPIET